VAGHGSVRHLGGPFADHDIGRDELLSASLPSGPRNSQRSSRPEARGEFTAQRTTSLDIESLVYGLVGDPHGHIIGEVDLEAVRNLFRAPRLGPPPVCTAAMATTNPGDIGTSNELAVWLSNLASQAVLHVVTQLVVLRKRRDLWPPSATVRMPLRSNGAVARGIRSGGGIAPQLAADG
jgi:hypothetical protein